MIEMMDAEANERYKKEETETRIESELKCEKYRGTFAKGINVTEDVVKITFTGTPMENIVIGSGMPSIVLYDSFDARVHDNAKAIEEYKYLEYGEIWFDGHYVSTNARNIEVQVTEKSNLDGRETSAGNGTMACEMIAGRYEGHVSIKMISPSRIVDVILALPDNSKASFLGITGENCLIRDIQVQKTGETVQAEDIKKIVSKLSFIDRLESDLPNVQVDRTMSAATEGILLRDKLQLDFHAMSLPWANLVWHCPYVALFYSKDQKLFGEGYREFSLIKINGECLGGAPYAENHFTMKKKENFPGWDDWKEKNKAGFECSIRITRKGKKIVTETENFGIHIENTTILHEDVADIYVALTGDEVALTDIRVIRQ